MALWNNKDDAASKPKFLEHEVLPPGTQVVFVSNEEALLQTNRAKGIKGGGWHTVLEYKDSNGDPRYKVEKLTAISTATVVSGDAADDAIVPDAEITVSISADPVDRSTAAGAATFSVTAAATPAGALVYQWQRKTAADKGYVDIAAANAASYAVAGATAANTGDKYRVIVSSGGSKKVTSKPATLTFVS